MILYQKFNKIPEFYMIIARKIFSRIGGARTPYPSSPMPMFVRVTVCSWTVRGMCPRWRTVNDEQLLVETPDC